MAAGLREVQAGFSAFGGAKCAGTLARWAMRSRCRPIPFRPRRRRPLTRVPGIGTNAASEALTLLDEPPEPLSANVSDGETAMVVLCCTDLQLNLPT
jgi:hypothetical protein